MTIRDQRQWAFYNYHHTQFVIVSMCIYVQSIWIGKHESCWLSSQPLVKHTTYSMQLLYVHVYTQMHKVTLNVFIYSTNDWHWSGGAHGWRRYSVQCEGPITLGYSLSVNDKDPCLYKHHLATLNWSAESLYKELWHNGKLAPSLSICMID